MKAVPVTAPRRWGRLAAATALVLLGVVSIRIGFAAFQIQLALTVLTSGWIVATLGFAAWHGASWSRVGPLLVLVAAAWFVGPLRWVAWIRSRRWLTGCHCCGSASLDTPC